MGNERRRGMMVKKKKKKTLGKHRGESQWTSVEKKEQKENWKGGLRGKGGDWKRDKYAHEGAFLLQIAVAATQYFNMLLDPDGPGLAVCVCVCCSLCISGSYKLLSALIWSARQVIPHCLSACCPVLVCKVEGKKKKMTLTKDRGESPPCLCT